ncbi:hypothetical protein SO802_024515 [Lithocarpus litseifolius]|uniref:Kinesin motor domain-containing protein n=1 Tax=Lithocarpus litseifolius TaxID=425828 RepID=A0AAW2C9M5_9ROSI
MDTSICHQARIKLKIQTFSKKIDVSCPNDALQHFRVAVARRSKRRMKMNDAASRSHFFFTVYIRRKNEDPMLTSEGVLHFIDLAGSEPMDNTYHSQLENPNVDSYEESKYYLEGSKIVMLANVSSSASSIIKSKVTLNFANEVSGRRCCAVLSASVAEVCNCKCFQGVQVLRRCSAEAVQMLSCAELESVRSLLVSKTGDTTVSCCYMDKFFCGLLAAAGIWLPRPAFLMSWRRRIGKEDESLFFTSCADAGLEAKHIGSCDCVY